MLEVYNHTCRATEPDPNETKVVVPAICLRPDEAAALCGVNKDTLRKHLPAIRIGPRCIRYHVDDVELYCRGGFPAVVAHEWARKAAGPPPHYHFVYFIQAENGLGEPGPIKIGMTKKRLLRDRLSNMQTGCPYPLWLTCAIVASPGLERALHERFAGHRIRGEWFHPHPDLLSFVESIRLAGSPIQPWALGVRSDVAEEAHA